MPTKIVVIGLGPGSPDALSLGALRALRRLHGAGLPIIARTMRHPTIEWLSAEEALDPAGSYDSMYDRAESFESLYADIVSDLLDRASIAGEIGYLVPGHPRFGEKTVDLLMGAARARRIRIEIVAGQSYLDAVFADDLAPVVPLRILDSLDLIRPASNFEPEPEPLDPRATHIVHQVYDRSIASELKLALLEIFPHDAAVTIVSAAGIPGRETRTKRALANLDRSGVDFDHLTTVVVHPLEQPEKFIGYTGLLGIMAKLRNPDGGCPWDREQTRRTLRRYLLEETYEVLDAMAGEDDESYCEELGDLLLQIVFHAQLAREAGEFGMRDVLRAVTTKLVRRHPHVFGDTVAEDSAQVLANWALIKSAEKGYENRKSLLDGVPREMPALMRAQEISRRAAKSGFEWPDIDGVFDKLDEEIAELRHAIATGDSDAIDAEMGDILFTAVNLARFRGVEAEDVLGKMLERFSARFRHIEEYARSNGRTLADLTQPEMERVWQLAKREQ